MIGVHNVCVEYSALVANVCVPGILEYDAWDQALDHTSHTSLWTSALFKGNWATVRHFFYVVFVS